MIPFETAFSATNLSPIPLVVDMRLKIHAAPQMTFFNPRIVNLTSGDVVEIKKEVTNGDEILFLSNGTAFLNGVAVTMTGNKTMTLKVGESTLRFEAEIGLPSDHPKEHQIGLFYDEDITKYEQPKLIEQESNIIKTKRNIHYSSQTRFDEAIFDYETPVADLKVSYIRIYPGSFTAIVPWDIPGFSMSITLKDENIKRLKVFGLPQKHIDALTNWAGKDKPFKRIQEFYDALNLFDTLSEADINDIKTLVVRRSKTIDKNFVAKTALKNLIISECLLTDTIDTGIDPRTQLSAIINRVKAAGIYADVAFEKRFWEHQELDEQFSMTWQRSAEEQDMQEGHLTIASVQDTIVEQEMIEQFNSSPFGLSGVFDYTYFDSLNGFA
jgi:hypothetical protein